MNWTKADPLLTQCTCCLMVKKRNPSSLLALTELRMNPCNKCSWKCCLQNALLFALAMTKVRSMHFVSIRALPNSVLDSIVRAIAMAYISKVPQPPTGISAPSTRGLEASWALLGGFYSVRVYSTNPGTSSPQNWPFLVNCHRRQYIYTGLSGHYTIVRDKRMLWMRT